jgi:hypothetical protein
LYISERKDKDYDDVLFYHPKESIGRVYRWEGNVIDDIGKYCAPCTALALCASDAVEFFLNSYKFEENEQMNMIECMMNTAAALGNIEFFNAIGYAWEYRVFKVKAI